MPKAKKDGKPKRAMTPFMLFSNANRDKVKAENPSISFGEVGKKLGELWSTATGDEKKKFEQEAAQDKIRYQREFDKYKQEHPHSDDEGGKGKKKGKRAKKEKDPNAPKRPMTAFFFYMNENRANYQKEHTDLKLTEVTKALSERWGKMSDDQKKKYVELAAKDKERYAAAVGAAGTPAKASKKAAKKEESEEGSDDEDNGSGVEHSGDEGSDE